MATPHRWVIGRGLLGSAIVDSRADIPHEVRVDWSSDNRALDALGAGAERFFETVGAEPWEVYWSAGRGVTSTPEAVVMAEAAVFERFLDLLLPESVVRAPGRVFLASSVGGAYAGSTDLPFTERTPTAPRSPYGRAKLRMEAALHQRLATTAHRGLIARITNLYGPGQDAAKGQGLISSILAGCLTRRPVSVYVSLDTLRDYIYADDCAAVVSAGMDRLTTVEPGTVVTKIVGSMNALSIGALIGEITRLQRRTVPLVLGQGDARGQAPDLRVRSEVWTDLDGLVATTIPAGLQAVSLAQTRTLLVSGL